MDLSGGYGGAGTIRRLVPMGSHEPKSQLPIDPFLN